MANVDYNKAYEMYDNKRCEMDAKAIEEEQKKREKYASMLEEVRLHLAQLKNRG